MSTNGTSSNDSSAITYVDESPGGSRPLGDVGVWRMTRSDFNWLATGDAMYGHYSPTTEHRGDGVTRELHPYLGHTVPSAGVGVRSSR
jgi:hypothetical protein